MPIAPMIRSDLCQRHSHRGVTALVRFSAFRKEVHLGTRSGNVAGRFGNPCHQGSSRQALWKLGAETWSPLIPNWTPS